MTTAYPITQAQMNALLCCILEDEALELLRSLIPNTGEPVGFCSVQPLLGNESKPSVSIKWAENTPVSGPLYSHPAPRTKPAVMLAADAQSDLKGRLDLMTAERDKLARMVEELEFHRTHLFKDDPAAQPERKQMTRNEIHLALNAAGVPPMGASLDQEVRIVRAIEAARI